MSIRRFPVSLAAMRSLAVAALLCASVSGFTTTQFRYRDFFSGVTVGILLVLVIALFRAHSAEVDGDETGDANRIQRPGLPQNISEKESDNSR
jgi:hypothetical protein